jgi:rubrerythrin
MQREKTAVAFNRLIALDFDAADAYEAAVARLDDPLSRKRLESFREDHLRHTRTLSSEVRRLGGSPVSGPDYKRVMTRGLVILANLMGDRLILRAMKVNEEQTNRAYEAALKLRGLTPRQHAILERHLRDERRHRAWIVARIKAMRKGAA